MGYISVSDFAKKYDVSERTEERLSEGYIKELHRILKEGISDGRKDWFAVGGYKRLPNEVGGNATTTPENVHRDMKALLTEYNAKKNKTFEDIIDLHQRFETIHPFQDGNGRVGSSLHSKSAWQIPLCRLSSQRN